MKNNRARPEYLRKITFEEVFFEFLINGGYSD